jgi:hypothetical protein
MDTLPQGPTAPSATCIGDRVEIAQLLYPIVCLQYYRGSLLLPLLSVLQRYCMCRYRRQHVLYFAGQEFVNVD